jgi:hypothetical protein
MIAVVKVEVLYIDHCRNWVEVGRRLREALDAIGFKDAVITFRRLETAEDAADVPFAGSPTIILNGEDLFPAGTRTSELACRVYRTPAGLAGAPTTEQLIEALSTHAG